jgi:hypothetical protein
MRAERAWGRRRRRRTRVGGRKVEVREGGGL